MRRWRTGNAVSSAIDMRHVIRAFTSLRGDIVHFISGTNLASICIVVEPGSRGAGTPTSGVGPGEVWRTNALRCGRVPDMVRGTGGALMNVRVPVRGVRTGAGVVR